ncbi:MAG: hypothetical protein QNL43_01900 [Crocinitomicaceae bacterium]
MLFQLNLSLKIRSVADFRIDNFGIRLSTLERMKIPELHENAG